MTDAIFFFPFPSAKGIREFFDVFDFDLLGARTKRFPFPSYEMIYSFPPLSLFLPTADSRYYFRFLTGAMLRAGLGWRADCGWPLTKDPLASGALF